MLHRGYPYGTAEVVIDKEEAYATTFGSKKRKQELSNTVKTKAAIKLTSEVEDMFQRLHTNLEREQAE